MSNPTTPFSWQMPTATDLVTDLPADFEVFGQAVATSMADLLGGTSGQILAKNSNTDMDFVWIANDQGDITGITATSPLTGGGTSGAVTVGIQDALTTQKGAVQLSDSTSTTSSILAATPTAVKSAYDLADGAIAKTTLTTAGDVLYRNATVPTRLGIGTAGQVLQVNSGATAPEWATPAAGGMTLISTTSLSGASTTISFGSTYTNLMFVFYEMTNNTADGAVSCYFNSGTTNNSGVYTTGSTSTSYNDTTIRLSANQTLNRANNVNAMTLIVTTYNPPSTTYFQPFQVFGGWYQGNRVNVNAGGHITIGAALTSLTVSNSGGNFSAGKVQLYGIK